MDDVRRAEALLLLPPPPLVMVCDCRDTAASFDDILPLLLLAFRLLEGKNLLRMSRRSWFHESRSSDSANLPVD